MPLLSFLSNQDILILTTVAISVWYLRGYLQERRDNPNNLPLPPGPRGFPIIGSLFAFPRHKPWIEYDKWFKTYGDMIYFQVFGHSFLILGSLERVYDIFERRSSNYSDRPRLVMLNELMDMTYVFAFQRYGTWWRRHRRTFHDHFHPNIIHKYQHTHIDTAREFIRRLLDSPEKFIYHTRFAFADSILKAVYGIGAGENEAYVGHGETTLAGLAAAGHPGAFLVDIFPIMRIIPKWFPGAEWKRKAAVWRYVNSIVANCLWDTVKKQVETGSAKPCIATVLLENMPDDGSPESNEEETVRRDACAVAFVGETPAFKSLVTVSIVSSFFMAMALYPEVQKKAQAELDQLLGGRLPEFSDKPHLPYINALMKEAARWQPVTPMAAAHMSSEPDVYNGYYILKGTYVFGNAWTILHNPEVYKDPLVFDPDRFLKNGELDPSVQDPNVASFGFGRRICPGRFYSHAGFFTIVAHVLSVFDIRPSLDENGNEVKIVPSMTDGLVSFPEKFECRITPRSKEAEQLIRNSSLMTEA